MTLMKRNTTFLRLWLAQIFASFGDSFYDVAIVWHLLQVTSSALVAGGIALSAMGGRMFGSSVISTKVDVWHTRRVMLVSSLLRAVVLFLLIFWMQVGTVPIVGFYAVSFLTAFLNACGSSAQRKSISEVVEKEELVQANASFNVAASFVQIASWALGGVVVNTLGIVLALLINGATTLVFSGLVAISNWKSVREVRSKEKKSGVLGGFLAIKAAPKSVHAVIVLEIVALFLMGFYWAAFPLFIYEISDAVGYGLQGAFFGVGCLITALYLTRSSRIKKLGRAFAWGVMAYSVGIVVSGAIPHISVFIFGVFISGLGNSFWETSRQTILHLSVPTEEIGKVFAVLELAINVCLIPAWLLGGFFADVFGPRLVMIAVGMSMIALLTGALFYQPLRDFTVGGSGAKS